MSFNAIRENKILAKISEFTVLSLNSCWDLALEAVQLKPLFCDPVDLLGGVKGCTFKLCNN